MDEFSSNSTFAPASTFTTLTNTNALTLGNIFAQNNIQFNSAQSQFNSYMHLETHPPQQQSTNFLIASILAAKVDTEVKVRRGRPPQRRWKIEKGC